MRGNLSINFTFSNSTSHYLYISRGNGIVANSRVLCVCKYCVGRHNGLLAGAIIAAIVSGFNLCGTFSRRKVNCTGATINSGCICRCVTGGNYHVNNRRDNRVVFDGCTDANSNVLADLGVVRIVLTGGVPVDGLTRPLGVCPRILRGIHIASGGTTRGSPTIRTTIGTITRTLNSANHVLMHRSNARPIIHIVIRTPSRSAYRGCISRIIRIVGGGNCVIWHVFYQCGFLTVRCLWYCAYVVGVR